MTNFEEIKRKIANMNIDELIEFCGGDTCENVLCAFVRDGDCCGNNCRVSYDCGGSYSSLYAAIHEPKKRLLVSYRHLTAGKRVWKAKHWETNRC
mgnify:CR=1 FL=1